jgi:hypothetical protein
MEVKCWARALCDAAEQASKSNQLTSMVVLFIVLLDLPRMLQFGCFRLNRLASPKCWAQLGVLPARAYLFPTYSCEIVEVTVQGNAAEHEVEIHSQLAQGRHARSQWGLRSCHALANHYISQGRPTRLPCSLRRLARVARPIQVLPLEPQHRCNP